MVQWHHQLSGHEFEQAPGVGDGQGGLWCCSPWGPKELDTTEWLNWLTPFTNEELETWWLSVTHLSSKNLEGGDGIKPSVGIWTPRLMIYLLHQGSIWSAQESWPGIQAKLLQSCLTFYDPTDCRPPGSSVHGILQGRFVEWVTMLSSRGSSWPRDWNSISYISCIGRWVLYH